MRRSAAGARCPEPGRAFENFQRVAAAAGSTLPQVRLHRGSTRRGFPPREPTVSQLSEIGRAGVPGERAVCGGRGVTAWAARCRLLDGRPGRGVGRRAACCEPRPAAGLGLKGLRRTLPASTALWFRALRSTAELGIPA